MNQGIVIDQRLEPQQVIMLEGQPNQPAKAKVHRDWLCTLIGLAVFCLGIFLLVATFRLAFQIFNAPPESALGAVKGQPIDLAVAGNSLVALLIKIGLLALMAVVGSMVCNRGIALYAHAKLKT